MCLARGCPPQILLSYMEALWEGYALVAPDFIAVFVSQLESQRMSGSSVFPAEQQRCVQQGRHGAVQLAAGDTWCQLCGVVEAVAPSQASSVMQVLRSGVREFSLAPSESIIDN
jgi:hypothetical protein